MHYDGPSAVSFIISVNYKWSCNAEITNIIYYKVKMVLMNC